MWFDSNLQVLARLGQEFVVCLKASQVESWKGINPFTGEETVFKARPARDVFKIRPLKKVKDMVG